MRKLIEDILYDRRKDAVTLPLRFVLRFFASVYNYVTSIRNFLYNKRILKAKDVPCRVISIGNLIVGGTGKTPVTMMTAKMLKEAGKSVVVISRGYKGQSKDPIVVSDGSSVLVSSIECGDEPHIIASSLQGVPVVVGRDRFAAAMMAYKRFKPDVIVLDDAMQHRRIYRNVDIITMDADNPLGTEYLLPHGLFRESPYSIRRAKAVVITRLTDEHNRERIERMVRYYNRNVLIFWSTNVAVGLREPGSSDKTGLDAVKGKKIAALSNIANPLSFYRLLESLGYTIVFKQVMPDHHRYTFAELDYIEKNSLKAGAELLIMTAKDERNFPADYNVKIIEKRVLDIEAVIVEEIEEYMKIIAPGIKK
ncbi:MAG TPA: tetraacyldisaccharide 4'-kinase [bacterium]|nr:tetraacyldisaccharide 4'-kinase [bacterium]